MAAHVHVTTTSSSEKNKVDIHHMPCKIKKNGSANVSKYFQPNVKTNPDGVLSASFRGYPLLGKEIKLPRNYSGFVLRETQEKLSEDSDRNIYVIGSFDKLTYWNYDKVPSSADQIHSVMDWIAISSVIFLRFGLSREVTRIGGLSTAAGLTEGIRDPEDNWITPSGNYNLINRVLQNNVISGSSSSLPKWRQDVGKNPFSIYNLGERGSGFRSRGQVQDFYELRDQCLQAGTLFEDPEFPCEDSSLFFSQRPRYGFEWKRPMEIVEDPQFFVEGVSRFDVEQGELGDCWLLAAIANLTLNSSLFYQIVPGDQDFEEDYCGIFHFRFWQYGRWVDVVIDDRLPTVRGELVFLRSSQKNEFWSALLEKAYAKLHGSYEALKGGSTCEAMEDFTAGVTEMYELNHEAPSNLFQMMIKAYERNSLMGCSLEPDPHVLEAKTPQGLVRGHAYSITRVTYVDIATPNMSGKIPLIRLRNPWGNDTEWNGAWSDQSAEWRFIPQHEKENIGLTFDNDGEFWMSYKDFMHYFDRLEICNLNPDSLTEEDEIAGKKKWEMSVFEGEWVRGVTAGGCRNHLQTFHHNPQYRITLTDVDDGDDENKCTVIVALMQKNRRSQRNMGVECLTIGFAIYHLDDPDRLPKPLNMEFFKYNSSCARSPSFINLREVSCRFRLSPGVYCIVPSTFDPNEEGEFLLRVFSEKKTHMEENDESVGMGKVDDRVIEPEPVDRDERREKDDKVRQFFNKLAGEDLEVDWKELQEILDYAMREELPNRTSTTNGNLLSTLFTTFCGTICNDPSITQVFGETKREGFSKDVCRSMVAMLDVDRSGKLGFEEFKSLWTDIRNWKAVFKLYDKANSGQLSAFELRQALNSAGYRLNNHILNVLVHRYGTKEGSITFDDFMMCAVKLKSMIDIFKEKDPENTNQATFTLEEWVERTLYS